jgi:hypothetical protein
MAIKCRTDIKKSIISKAISEHPSRNIKQVSASVLFIDNTSFPSGKAQAYRVAESIVNRSNKKFQGRVAYRREMSNGQEVVFDPEESLVTVYYNEYLKSFMEKEARAIQKEDAQRAGIEYSDEYLFSEPDSTNPLYDMYEDMANLDLTPAVIEYLYSESSQRLRMDKFAQAAKDLVANLRGLNYTNDDILDKLKCL